MTEDFPTTLAPFVPTTTPAPRVHPPAPPVRRATAPNGRQIPALSGQQKAAILVRLLLVEGAELNLAALPEAMQAELTEQMAQMRLVDRDTMLAVVSEFVETLEQVGLSFPEGLEGALAALGGKLSPGAASRLRRLAGAKGHEDPRDRIAAAEPEALIDLLTAESIEVAAVVLSKLPVARAADLLGRMPGERARRVAFAIAQTEGIAPEAVGRIGLALATELDRRPAPAFDRAPAARVGAILNSAEAKLRDTLLAGLEAESGDFAEGVRRSIFTFSDIPARIAPRDVPRILREVDQPSLITALAVALPDSDGPLGLAAEFLLANMSQRMAASLRDEIEARGTIKAKDGETAMSAVVLAIRSLVDAGEIEQIDPDDVA